MEKIDTIMENEQMENAYETKYVPTVDLAYDVYERSEKKNMQNFYAQAANKSFDELDFSSFISKSLSEGMFNSVFSIKSTEDFFAGVPDFYNPFRKVSTYWPTSADSIEVPALGAIVGGWNDQADNAAAKAASQSILVRNFPIFTKMELPLHFLNRVESHANYVKAILGMQRSKLERKAFVHGDGVNAPLGLLRDTKLNSKNLNYKQTEVQKLADDILAATFELASEFTHDACFMISSSMQAKIAKIKDTTGKYIFDNKTLFGYNVHTLDELHVDATRDVVLFGNFKYGHVICERQESEVRLHNLFDKPNTIGLSMPSNCGAALVCPEAIIALNTVVTA